MPTELEELDIQPTVQLESLDCLLGLLPTWEVLGHGELVERYRSDQEVLESVEVEMAQRVGLVTDALSQDVEDTLVLELGLDRDPFLGEMVLHFRFVITGHHHDPDLLGEEVDESLVELLEVHA